MIKKEFLKFIQDCLNEGQKLVNLYYNSEITPWGKQWTVFAIFDAATPTVSVATEKEAIAIKEEVSRMCQ